MNNEVLKEWTQNAGIEKHVKNCKVVVSDLLAFSRKGSSKMSISDVNKVVDGVIKFLSNNSDFRNVKLIFNMLFYC